LRMSSFKPKLYRSQDGCCICKAKSSSSRFTDSKKYEDDCVGCFKLEDVRHGEICNACVLIVKRWKKLPANTNKDWHHVVDARTGPGIKNVFKNKKKEVSHVTTPDKHVYKRKHVYRRRRKRAVPIRSDLDKCFKEQSYLLDFIDTDYWRRELWSCGVVYIGQLGEIMVDKRFSRQCSLDRSATFETVVQNSSSEVSGSLDKDLESQDPENEEFYAEIKKDKKDNLALIDTAVNNNDNDHDESFFEKLEKKMDTFASSPSLITSH